MRTVLATLLIAALAAAPAGADTLLVPAPGAKNLAWSGGYTAWAAPKPDGRWQLVVRTPDGTVMTPAIADFAAPPDPSIGSDRGAISGRRLLAVYSRCAGRSTIRGCDVYAYDLKAGGEERVNALATNAYSEVAASIVGGNWAFVRRGGARNGIYKYSAGHSTRRVSSRVPREMASNGTRVAYTYSSSQGGGLAIRRLSGEGSPLSIVSRLDTVPFSPQLTRFHAAWLVRAGAGVKAQATTRFTRHGVDVVEVRDAARAIPASTDSIAVGSSISRVLLLDAEGVKQPSPRLFA